MLHIIGESKGCTDSGGPRMEGQGSACSNMQLTYDQFESGFNRLRAGQYVITLLN